MPSARAVAIARRELEQHYPASGWVEHDAEEIWRDTLATRARGPRAQRRRACRASPRSASPISARPRSSGSAPPAGRFTAPSSGRTGAPRETAPGSKPPAPRSWCAAATGLLLDPYFSGTKVAWLLDHVRRRARARRARRARLRHHRQLPAVAADRRARARDRRHQRLAHAAVRHPPPVLGRGAAAR